MMFVPGNINLQNVPGQMISGLDADVVSWICEQSNQRVIEELSADFANNLQQLEEDGTDIMLPIEIENQLNDIELSSIPESSKNQMKLTASRFRYFLQSKNLDIRFEKFILNKYLRYFYSELKKQDGTYYAPPSLICFRAAIQRYLSSAEHGRPHINIISGHDFQSANRMLKAMVGKYLSSSNKCKPQDKFPPIEEHDMVQLRASFDRTTPKNLQNEVIFNCLYYFGLRGRETLRRLTKNTFTFNYDGKWRRYVSIASDNLSKNCKASLKPSDFEDARNTRMYEIADRPHECPVVALEQYLGKIPETFADLFPKPLTNPRDSNIWYCGHQAVGKNYLSELLPRLSNELQLSKRYTNHCVRVTTVSVMKEQGFANEDIASVTGHKNSNSVQR